MKKSMTRLSFLAGLSVLGIGCSSGPATKLQDAPSAQIQANWRKIKVEKHGFSLAAPVNWRKSRLAKLDPPAPGEPNPFGGLDPLASEGSGFDKGQMPPGTEDILKNMGAGLSAMSEQMIEEEKKRLAEAESRGIVLKLIDINSKPSPGETETHFSVLKESSGGSHNLESEAQGRKKEIRQKVMLLETEMQQEKIALPIGPAYKFTISGKFRNGDEIYRIVYLLVDDKDVYTISFICTGNKDQIHSIADAILQTFRVRPAQ